MIMWMTITAASSIASQNNTLHTHHIQTLSSSNKNSVSDSNSNAYSDSNNSSNMNNSSSTATHMLWQGTETMYTLHTVFALVLSQCDRRRHAAWQSLQTLLMTLPKQDATIQQAGKQLLT